MSNNDLPGEKWRWAKCITGGKLYDFTGNYKCSNKGRVRKLNTGKTTYGSNDGRGYRSIMINGVTHLVHRIIATTFIPNPENKPTVDHIDTNPSNNCVENLRWFTQNEQMNENEITRQRHIESAKKNIKIAREVCRANNYAAVKEFNESINYSNLKKAQEVSKKAVYCITTKEIFESVTAAANTYGITDSVICRCCKGKIEYAGFSSDGKKLVWCYYRDIDTYVPYKSKSKKEIYCITTKEIFESAAKAAEKYGINATGITACCRGERKNGFYKGKRWKFLDDYKKEKDN